MKKYVILLLVLSLLAANAAAQENRNASKKLLTNISLNTDNRTGHLVYTELYYSVNSSGNLTYDTGRKYFEGNITSPRIRIQIIRPLDPSGKPYPDERIRGIAILDNKTIINDWYKTSKPTNITADVTATEQPAGKKSPGFGTLIGAAALVLSVYICRRQTKQL